MPLPVAHSLVGASIVTLAMRRFDPRLDWAPVLVGAVLGLLPDLDLLLTWGLRLGIEYHGSYTHSILFALAAGAAFAAVRCSPARLLDMSALFSRMAFSIF